MTTPAAEQPKKPEIAVEGSEVLSGHRFPSPFYNPATVVALMKPPLVDTDGESHSTLKPNLADDTSITVYNPNRALKAIIQEDMKMVEQTFLGSVSRLDRRVKSSFGHVTGKSLFGVHRHRPFPESFYHPIICDLMEEPCMAKEEATYERMAIEKWAREKGIPADLRDNNVIYDLLQEQEEGRNDETMHPSILCWKGEFSFRRKDQHPQPLVPPELDAAVGDSAPTIPAEDLPTKVAQLNGVEDEKERTCRSCFWLSLELIFYTTIAILLAIPILFVVCLMMFYAACRVFCKCSCSNDPFFVIHNEDNGSDDQSADDADRDAGNGESAAEDWKSPDGDLDAGSVDGRDGDGGDEAFDRDGDVGGGDADGDGLLGSVFDGLFGS